MKKWWSKLIETISENMHIVGVVGGLAAYLVLFVGIFVGIPVLLILLNEHQPAVIDVITAVVAVVIAVVFGAFLLGGVLFFAFLLLLVVGVFIGVVRACSPPPKWDDQTDWSERIASLRKHVESGDADAQYELAEKFRTANGVAVDMHKAEYWYRKAAEQGHAEAQYSVGVLSEHGHTSARWRLGSAFSESRAWITGPPLEREIHLFRYSAENWEPVIVGQRIWAYVTNAAAKSIQESVRWYHKAAEQGHAKAQNALCYAYWHGQGVAENKYEACVWWLIAEENDEHENEHEDEDEDKDEDEDEDEDDFLFDFLSEKWELDLWRETCLDLRNIRPESGFVLSKSEIISAQKEAVKRMEKIERRKAKSE